MSDSQVQDGITRYLTFRLGEYRFGTTLLSIKMVSILPQITKIAKTPSYFLGLGTIQKETVGVIHLCSLFGISSSGNDLRKCLLIFPSSSGGGPLGVMVDELTGIVNLEPEQIETKTHIKSKVPQEYLVAVAKIQDSYIHLLDLDRLLSQDDLNLIKKKRQ